MNPSITVTDAATTYIEKIVKEKEAGHFRLSIKKTGCSGYAYSPIITEIINETDLTIEIKTNLTIHLDRAWIHLMEGLVIDFLEEDKSGLKQKRLTFENPNEKSRCGCGESFHIEKE